MNVKGQVVVFFNRLKRLSAFHFGRGRADFAFLVNTTEQRGSKSRDAASLSFGGAIEPFTMSCHYELFMWCSYKQIMLHIRSRLAVNCRSELLPAGFQCGRAFFGHYPVSVECQHPILAGGHFPGGRLSWTSSGVL